MESSTSSLWKDLFKISFFLVVVAVAAAASFHFGARAAHAEPGPAAEPKVIYPKQTDLDFEGAKIEGELRNPGEFYFRAKTEEKFDSLLKRRKNFHREMLRDGVLL